MAGSPFPTYGAMLPSSIVVEYMLKYGFEGIEASSSGSSSGYGYGYGGYGFGEHVSAGRSDAFEHFERGTDAGELVYQSPNGNVYPWGEGDAIRFRMQTEYGVPSPPRSPPVAYGLNPQHQSFAYRMGSTGPSSSHVVDDTGRIVPGPLVRSPGEVSDEAIFEQFDPVEGPLEAPRDGRERGVDGQQRGDDTVSRARASEPQAGIRREDDAVRIIEPQPSGSADSVDLSGSPREREPSPDFQPKINPRIASLKSESGWCSPPSSPPQTNTEINTSLAPSSTTLAIPTPGISPAHEQEYARMRTPPDSPVLRSGLLSPPDMSPRGRSICTSPVSGSATSSSQARSESRSVSESRSDSRGRSRTRNSSLASSPEQGEQERGRSRSRSTASGANSPLGDNGSPSMRGSSLAIGGIGVGLGIGGGCSAQHSGREIRDGRGIRLYRKTSEDFIRGNSADGKGGQSDVYPSHGTRGRNREGKRVSESLSPPVVGSPPVDRRSAVSPPHASGVYRPIPSSGLRSYPANLPGRSNSGDSIRSLGSDRSNVQSPDGSSLLSSRRSNSSRSGSREHTDSTSADETLSTSASTVIGNGSTLPPCIPEEDEVKVRTGHPSEVQNGVESKDYNQPRSQDRSSFSPSSTIQKREEGGSNRHSPTIASSLSSPKAEGTMNPDPGKTRVSSSSNLSSPAGAGRNKANGASEGTGDGTGKTFADRTADLMSSARTLLGTFWNSSNS
ncbi:uncharacterized protein FOMMEDRAFT_16886 [Fomitiporia mediterranea MF3/22]|uniref:uncharacterized protein n=1 Tax=Fomitiporia mediterranea (strain MF3/22) TaxID=694068 RepID=UPI0004409A96|nr:uncharacterized protein FOMMEDRAFT_16886 [Fomitiporia mediterranea MF3/22]EJD08566.1 hypothetical protein FOMMEDRAFT_16886 [Fomitiporia mediterranea MF3/22]